MQAMRSCAGGLVLAVTLVVFAGCQTANRGESLRPLMIVWQTPEDGAPPAEAAGAAVPEEPAVAVRPDFETIFDAPWRHPDRPLIIDAYWDNPLDWDKLATETRVAAIIHKASEGFRADAKYSERRAEALRRGYLWGSYHLGVRGNPEKQAEFYVKSAQPGPDEVMALDLEDLEHGMTIPEAARFIRRIHEKTGRYPLVYGNHSTIEQISSEARESIFRNTPLWYARFRESIPDFPEGIWSFYTLWQFSSEYKVQVRVAGTRKDIDVNVYHGTGEELRRAWPFS
ncbi:MAG TPA: glycoside hydrolase family 25 protein [Candidatus Hydrogenedentes bacterium]|nr:glycoside hydrolase family 25 protein [Candidatus Hydrogenedentota bacterium]